MNVLRVCYKTGVRFDEAYYVAKHLPLAGSICGPFGLKSVKGPRQPATPERTRRLAPFVRGCRTNNRRCWRHTNEPKRPARTLAIQLPDIYVAPSPKFGAPATGRASVFGNGSQPVSGGSALCDTLGRKWRVAVTARAFRSLLLLAPKEKWTSGAVASQKCGK